MSIVRDQGWQFDSQRMHHMWLKKRKKIEVTDLCEINGKYCM